MLVKPLRHDLIAYARKRNLTNKLNKQIKFFSLNPRYPFLNTEILEPSNLKIYSFRIDQKYRAIFIFITLDEIEIIDINNHYK